MWGLGFGVSLELAPLDGRGLARGMAAVRRIGLMFPWAGRGGAAT